MKAVKIAGLLLVLLTVLAGLAGRGNASGQDLLAMALSGKCDQEVEAGYYNLSEVLLPYDRDGLRLVLPARNGRHFNRIIAPVVSVKPSTRYIIDWEVLPRQSLKLMLYAVYENPRNGRDPLNHIMTFENSSAFMQVEKEIVTPPDATAMTLHIYLSAPDMKPDTMLAFFKSLKIREIGPSLAAPEIRGQRGRNILPLGSFDALQTGEKGLAKMGLFTNFTQKPYEAEIVTDESGRNILRVKYTPGDFQYVSWYSPGVMNLYGSAGIMRCRMRGKGRVQLMVFWGRPKFHTIFRHFGYFELTPEWQEYSVGIGCDDPLAVNVAATVACRDNPAEFEISDISFTMAE